MKGQAVFITGAAKGMGRAVTVDLAEAGADIVLAGRDLPAMAPVADEVRALGRTAVVVHCDVTDEASVTAAIAAAWAALTPQVWGLVNIAGGTGPSGKMLWEHSVQEFQEIFDVNVLGSFLTMKHMLPRMMAMKDGAIVNIGGTFGFKGVWQASAYGATKWALRGLTKSAALEAGGACVRVNMVSPGGVEGPRLKRQLGEEAAREGIPYQQAYDRFCQTAALRRVSTDRDVALQVLHLLGDGGRNVTGQDLLVDGGTIL